jgi:hypothetical protein
MKKFTDKINESVENKIPTAEKFVEEYTGDDEDGYLRYDTVEYMCREFAKLHVEAALKAASEDADIIPDPNGMDWDVVSKDSILSAYPLENIK